LIAVLLLAGSILSCGSPAEKPAVSPAPPTQPLASATTPTAPSREPVKPAEPPAAQSGPVPGSSPDRLTTAQIVARSEPSVALIRGKRSSGTGFLVRPGILVTNSHVIDGELITNLEIQFPSAKEGQRGPFKTALISKDPKRDLAFLKVQSDLPPLEIAGSYVYQKGDDVIVIGNPGVGGKMVLENAISRGVMSTKAVIGNQNFYQLGIAINPGNSGGPVIDASGKVIGVVTLKTTKLEATAFCIPVDELNAMLAKVESQPQPEIAAVSATAGKGSELDLRYHWKAGETYVYKVHVAYQAGKSVVSFDGSSIYHAKSGDDSGATLAYRGWLISRLRPKDPKSSDPAKILMPRDPATTELQLDPKGDVQDTKGTLGLPFLGDLSMLMIEPLADEPLAQWDEVHQISLNEIHTSTSSAPLSLGRPSAINRLRESRLKNRMGERGGGLAARNRGAAAAGAGAGANARRPGAMPGSRLGGRSALRGGRNAPAPRPPQQKVEVTVIGHPGQERSEYALGARSGDSVAIQKTYELKSEEMTGDKPHLLMTGQATITFDTKAGVPLALEYKATITENLENATVNIPVEVSCKLLEGDERARALRFPIIPVTAMIPLMEADVRQAQTDLKSADSGRRVRAAQRLRDAAPLDGRREAVAKALLTLLDDRDGGVRNAAIQALGVWGDKDAATALIKRLNDDRYGSRAELFEALGRIEPDEPTAKAMVEWLKRDAGQAGRVLRAMGPVAETALLELVASAADTNPREEACRVLKDIGTSQSVPVLQTLVGLKDNEEFARIAEGAVRSISARFLKESEVAAIVKTLDSPDGGARRAAVHRLLAASPIESSRSSVAKALAKRLDDPDEGVQRDAIQALGVWGDQMAVKTLTASLKNPSYRPWKEATQALAKLSHTSDTAEFIAGWAKKDGRLVMGALQEIGPPAEPALIALITSQVDWPIRVDACKVLGVIGSKQSIPALQESALNKKDGLVAMAAENALKTIVGKPLTDSQWEATLEDLKSPDPNRRREAAERLAVAEPDAGRRAAAASALAAALVEKDDRVLGEVVRALKTWGTVESAQALIDRCNDQSFRPWREALEALAHIDPSPKTAEAIIARMPDDARHCSNLLRELGPVAEPALLKAFQSAADPRVRREAGRALETFGTDASLAILRQAGSKTGDGALARAAEDALKGIAERE